MKGRVQPKNGYWYVVIERGKGQTPVWRKTGLKEKNNRRRAEGMIEQIVADYEASVKSPGTKSTVCSMQEQASTNGTPSQGKGRQTRNEPQPADDPLFSDVVKIYLEVAKVSVKENTYEKYRDAAETHIIPYFKKLKVRTCEIDTLILQDYITRKKRVLKTSTLKTHKTVLNQTFKYAIRPLRLIETNPMVDVVLGKPSETIVNYYDANQMNALLERIAHEGNQIAAPVILGAYYGLRREEILGLQWSAVNFDKKTIEIRRTAIKAGKKTIYADTVKSKDSYRTLPLDPEVETYLRRLQDHQRKMLSIMKKGYIKNSEICKWDDGHLVRPDYVSSRFRVLLKKFGMPPLKFHELRHSTASLLLSKGYSLQEIKEWLGHANIKSTMIYAHLNCDESKRKMAKAIGGTLNMPKVALPGA